jgi:hypothetical protein
MGMKQRAQQNMHAVIQFQFGLSNLEFSLHPSISSGINFFFGMIVCIL